MILSDTCVLGPQKLHFLSIPIAIECFAQPSNTGIIFQGHLNVLGYAIECALHLGNTSSSNQYT